MLASELIKLLQADIAQRGDLLFYMDTDRGPRVPGALDFEPNRHEYGCFILYEEPES